jgi:tetratricopeptide (TPR) repeat protein
MRCSAKTSLRRLGRRACATWVLILVGTWSVRADEEVWSKGVTDHFTILTTEGEAVARKWAVELEQFRRGLQLAVPVPTDRLRPVTVVLFKNARAMERFAPLEAGKPAKIGGFFVRANDINTIMLTAARNAEETRQVIFHEAVHWHLSAREGFMPLWLSEGLAEVYATFELPDKTSYAFGAAMDDHVELLQQESLLPLPKLLGVGRDSLLYNEGTRTGIFYAQSWAFVHYLLFGEHSPGREAVQRYLELLRVVRSADDAFLTAFGADYAAFEIKLRKYITSGRYHKNVYSRGTIDLARTVRLSPALPADVELAKGSLLLGARSADDAEPFLGRAAELAPSDPRPWELLGHIAVERKDFPTALTLLTQAVNAGSSSYLVYYNRAVARLPELTQTWMPSVALDPLVMDAAAADFRKAIELSPSHIASYEGLAGVMRGMATFVPADLELLQRGSVQSPGNAMLEAGIAAAEMRAGKTSEGRARLARLCARHPTTTSVGMTFARRLLANEQLLTEIDDINRLSKEKRLEEVIAIADGALDRTLDPGARAYMENVRRRMDDYKIIRSAVQDANQGEVAKAKQALSELLESDADPIVMKEAQRILLEIARQQEQSPIER